MNSDKHLNINISVPVDAIVYRDKPGEPLKTTEFARKFRKALEAALEKKDEDEGTSNA